MSKLKKGGLGKGLSAIFNEKQLPDIYIDDSASRVDEVSLSLIEPNPYQPRRVFKDEEIDELALSIKEQGLIQPITLRKQFNKYQIIAGERRYRAHQKLGKDKVTAIIYNSISDKRMMEWALIENIQRVQLSSIEEAKAFSQLIQEHGYRHEDLAKAIGKSRTNITNTMRLLNLPETVQAWIHDGSLTAGHARNLLKPDVSDPEKLALKWIQNGTSVRQAEASTPSKPKATPVPKNKIEIRDPNVVEVERNLMYALGTNVNLQIKKSRGRIEISFESWEDLERISKMINAGSEHI